MDTNYNWSKVVQSMKSGRMGHASIYDGTDEMITVEFVRPKSDYLSDIL